MRKSTITFETDKETLEEAEKVFSSLGLTLEEAINLFLEKCIECNDIPFSYEEPSEQLLEAFSEMEEMENNPEKYKRYDNLDDLFRDLNKDD